MISVKLVPCAIKLISKVKYPPEYASSSVVVMVPTTLRPTRKPERSRSRREIAGFSRYTSTIEALTSIAKSMIAPEEARNTAPMKISESDTISYPEFINA